MEDDLDAARLARHLKEDGVDPNLARSLAEHLTDEIEHSVATKDHVDTVVTREVQGRTAECSALPEQPLLRPGSSASPAPRLA
jgi:hypothetical protein